MIKTAIAKLKFLNVSPTKIKKIIDKIRKKKIIDIINLNNMQQKSGQAILKLLKSAIFNAINNNQMKLEKLFIHEIFVTKGPILKRICVKAKGKSGLIYKRKCHVVIFLKEN